MGPQDALLVIGQSDVVSHIDAHSRDWVVSRATTDAGLDYLDTGEQPVGAVLTAHEPPERDGFRLLDQAGDVPVVLLAREGTSALATRALSEGAASYVDLAVVDDEAAAISDALDALETAGESRATETDSNHIEEFTSIISHELRTPVQKARSGVDLIAADCDSDYIGEVQATLDRLEELLDDLLAVAKYGDSVEELEPVALDTVVEETWPDPPGVELQIDGPLPTVAAEPSRLRQLFENLFRNSVDHGSTQLTVRVGVIDEPGAGADSETVGIYVADDGPGIPPEKRQQVFEYGYTDSDDGTGLGLAICERIADALGWEIVATESRDGGARFEITQLNRA